MSAYSLMFIVTQPQPIELEIAFPMVLLQDDYLTLMTDLTLCR